MRKSNVASGSESRRLRLGVNIDHVATLRNARGEGHPDLLQAALLAQRAGADGLTVHLREDRRHIKDADVFTLREQCTLPMNLEMAATSEMQAIALKVKPNAVCLVPEKRQELTTEGGLDAASNAAALSAFIAPIKDSAIRVSLFVDPVQEQIEAAAACGADIIELHTGPYAKAQSSEAQAAELARLEQAATYGASLGLEIHAGHGLTEANVGKVAAIPQIIELNIGHYLIGNALFVGLDVAIAEMRHAMNAARAQA